MKKKITLIITILLAIVFVAFTQERKENNPKDKSETEQLQEEKMQMDEEMSGGDFTYKPNGRRDPFWDLLRGKDVKIKREAKEGIEGLSIDELDLEGILFKQGRYIALFKGPDGRPYDVKVGDNVYDGEIIKIDVNTVVFKRQLPMGILGGAKEKIITKRLSPEEEASDK